MGNEWNMNALALPGVLPGAQLDVGEEWRHRHPSDGVKGAGNLRDRIDREETHDSKQFAWERSGFACRLGRVESQDPGPHPQLCKEERDCPKEPALNQGVEERALHVGGVKKVAISPEPQSYPRRLL